EEEDLPVKFTAPSASANREEAIERVDRNAQEQWKEAANESVREIALENEQFTTDDVRRVLDAKPVITHELRALGAMMIKAYKTGIIQPSSEFKQSIQVQCHRRRS